MNCTNFGDLGFRAQVLNTDFGIELDQPNSSFRCRQSRNWH